MGRANREKHEGHVMEHNHFASFLLLFLFSFAFSECYCGGVVGVRQESAEEKAERSHYYNYENYSNSWNFKNVKNILRVVLPDFVSMTTLKIPGLAGSVRGSMFSPR